MAGRKVDMVLLILGGVVILLILWRGWGKPVLTRGQWRAGAGLFAVMAIGGGALVVLRGAIVEGLGLAAAGLVAAFAARGRRGPRPKVSRDDGRGRMSLEQARSLLGVGAAASAAEIKTAYAKLMRVAHPDKGGTTGLAAQLNAARDRLLKR
jgi:hypothetical protein